MKPIIKSAYPIYWIDEKRVRIGAQYNFTRELTDSKGELQELIPLLNGNNTVEDIVHEMLCRLPYLSKEDVLSGLMMLSNAGLLEDSEQYAVVPERERSNYAFFSVVTNDVYNGIQKQLENSHVALLGLGGGGSACLPQILSLGIGEVSLVDADVVEMGNLNRQTLYRVQDIGKKKVCVAEQYCRDFAPDCKIHVYDMYLDSVDSVASVVENADCVICAIDEPPFVAQRRVNSAVVKLNIPCVFLLSQHTCGRFFSVVPHQSGCMDCLHISDSRTDEEFVKQFQSIMHPYRHGKTAVISPHVQRLTSFAVDEMLRLLTHYAEPFAVGKQIDVDYLTGNLTEVMSWSREVGCPTCGVGDSKYDYLFKIASLEGADE